MSHDSWVENCCSRVQKLNLSSVSQHHFYGTDDTLAFYTGWFCVPIWHKLESTEKGSSVEEMPPRCPNVGWPSP